MLPRRMLSVHGFLVQTSKELSFAPWVTEKWTRDHKWRLRGQTINTQASAVYRNLEDGGLQFLKMLEMRGSRKPM